VILPGLDVVETRSDGIESVTGYFDSRLVPEQLFKGGTHRAAMTRFWSELGDAAFTSVWTPDHINPLWVRCPDCRKMADYEKNAGQCACGCTLPEAPAYF
jgi:hypothetical protein